MISKLTVKGFRILRDFEWEPREGTNVIVGDNSTGKSTILDAIELVTRGTCDGLAARYALAPDWFNAEAVAEFFREKDPDPSKIPEIEIAVEFGDDPAMAPIKGCNGPDPKVDAPGIMLKYSVPMELLPEFMAEARVQAGNSNAAPVVPTEYYTCEWKDFSGKPVVRKPRCVTCARVDATPEPHSKAVDSYAKRMVSEELSDEQLRQVSGAFRKMGMQVDEEILSKIATPQQEELGLQLDKSPRTDWKNSVVLHKGGIPLSSLGSAEQVFAKCSVSLGNAGEASLLLVEEPECHLSHANLWKLLDIVNKSVGPSRQAFVTTHSPYVLNRLGLDGMTMMSESAKPTRIGELSKGTVRYFRRLSGFDTLRFALASRCVLVEGPTDEMVFEWAFYQLRETTPQACGIDILACGTQHKRFLELARALKKKGVVAIRDNDGEAEADWLKAAKEYVTEGNLYITGHDGEGVTIEPQMVFANDDPESLELLAQITESKATDAEKLTEYLTKHKVVWSLRLLDAGREATKALTPPRYIIEAIEFIDPEEEEDAE